MSKETQIWKLGNYRVVRYQDFFRFQVMHKNKYSGKVKRLFRGKAIFVTNGCYLFQAYTRTHKCTYYMCMHILRWDIYYETLTFACGEGTALYPYSMLEWANGYIFGMGRLFINIDFIFKETS